MSLPEFLHAHRPTSALYHAIAISLQHSPFAEHAQAMALKSVLHAAAWLAADPATDPYYATVQDDRIRYHHTAAPAGQDAAQLHLAALFDDGFLSHTGVTVATSLRAGATPEQQQQASSQWQLQVRLFTRFGLHFEQRLSATADD